MIFNVLVAEPSNAAWIWIARGIRSHFEYASIVRVKDGAQALRFVFRRGFLTEEPPTPNLIVLAAELPVVPASDVITRLRDHPRTRCVPVIVRWRDRDWREVDFLDAFATQDPLLIVGSDALEAQLANAVHASCVPMRLADRYASREETAHT